MTVYFYTTVLRDSVSNQYSTNSKEAGVYSNKLPYFIDIDMMLYIRKQSNHSVKVLSAQNHLFGKVQMFFDSICSNKDIWFVV